MQRLELPCNLRSKVFLVLLMPTPSGRAGPFNPWVEDQRDSVIYQGASWLGMFSLATVLQYSLISKVSKEAATVVCRSCCFSATPSLASSQISAEGQVLCVATLPVLRARTTHAPMSL